MPRPQSRYVLTHRLGSTELVVSGLGLGLAALGRPAYITLGGCATSASTAPSLNWSVDAMTCWTPPMRRAFGTSTLRDRTAWPRSSRHLAEDAQPAGRGDYRRIEVGLHVRGSWRLDALFMK